jgi:aryl-alcohol dehydrogenase-like predicted oxidoreductase
VSKGAFPILGARTMEHFTDGLKGYATSLTADHIKELDELSTVSLGYPHDLLATVRG